MPDTIFAISGCWQPDPFGSGVNIIVGRGEGNNGVITVGIQEPVNPPPDPIDLTAADITDLDLNVYTDSISCTTYGMADLETTSFLFLFSKVWPTGVTANYRIRVNC